MVAAGSPEISIVVPAYNAERYIGPTLDSVRAQTVAAWEVVVVDDGSRDGTRQVAEQYAARDPRIRVIGQINSGVAAARNRGWAATAPSSTYVTFLDHDDLRE